MAADVRPDDVQDDDDLDGGMSVIGWLLALGICIVVLFGAAMHCAGKGGCW